MKFKELGLSKPLLKIIENVGYNEATPIQEQAIPQVLNNRDVLGIAQTGTGKTAAFSLPIIDNLIKNSEANKKIKVLILSPTRELAIQTRDCIRDFSKGTDFKCSVILGGVNQTSQINVLKKGIDILVATPGRLVDLTKQKLVNLSNVSVLVLDEADTMLDMGFIKDVKYLISKTPQQRQTLLFSATMSKEMEELSETLLNDPVNVITTPEATPVEKINQQLYHVEKNKKFTLLLELLNNDQSIKSVLVFTRTKHGANKLGEQFEKKNIKCSVIHGNKSQSSRVRALNDFKTGKTIILIATDIAARGIDINELSHVINYDIPEHPEVYVHRIGRTARAGKDGTAISFCSKDELQHLKDIEKLTKQKINVVVSKNNSTVITDTPKEDVKKPHKSLTNNYQKSTNYTKNSRQGSNKRNDNRKNYTTKTGNTKNNRYSKTQNHKKYSK